MRTMTTGLLLSLCAATGHWTAGAQEKKAPGAIDPSGLKPEKKEPKLTPKELSAKVIAEIQKVQEAGGKQAEVIKAVDAGLDKFIAAIEANPKAPETAEYAAAAVPFLTSEKSAQKLIKVVKEKTELLKGDKPAFGFILAMAEFDEKFLDSVIADNPSKELAGLGAYMKASAAMGQYAESESDADKKRVLELAAKVPAGLKIDIDGKSEDFSAKAAEFKEQVARIEALAVGKPMPDLKSKDLDGKAVKLSDYKGKVVVVDVWATWCGPCKAMIPHERELVEKMKEKPFAFISVSGDDKVGDLKEFLKTEQMPWTHWHDGGDGEVMKALNINHFPTIYVVDAKGGIRYKEIRGKEMDKAVEKLVKEAEGK